MKDEFFDQLNEWGHQRVPFLFLIDFEQQKPLACRVSEVDPLRMLYDFNGVSNAGKREETFFIQSVSPLSIADYRLKFDRIMDHLERGDSFLTNLTIKTPIEAVGDLRQCFYASKARYRLWVKDEFVVFSPEIFIQIKDDRIYSYPMKGTIDASTFNARSQILEDEKEMAEHVTMVDLIRNDLAIVAGSVRVARFRYIDEIKSRERNLLQVSSEIEGVLPPGWRSEIGTILSALLPAGSISGAPKAKTCEIIRETEQEPRGYYTGICGYFDGENLDSGVMIRFIEQKGSAFYYRSGGGITNQSHAYNEYQEALSKIYVPVN